MESIKAAKKDFRRILLMLGLFSLFVNMLLLTMPLYMLQVYDRVLPSQSFDTLTFLSIIAVAALVVLGLLEMVRSIIAARAAARLDAHLGGEALVASIEAGRFTNGDIQPMRDLAAVRNMVGSRTVFALLDLPFAPLFIGILYFIHPHLFWLTLAGAVVLTAFAIVNQWYSAEPSKFASEKSMKAMTSAQAFARNSETLRAMGMIDSGINQWGRENASALTAQNASAGRMAVISGISRTIRTSLQIAVLGYGAYLVLNNQMTAGMIFAASIISGRGLQPIDQVIGGWRQFTGAWASWKRVSATLAKLPQEKQYTELPAIVGNLLVDGAILIPPNMPPDKAVLKRVSLQLDPGEVLGIIGPSGAGKSTLARVIVGSLPLQSGQVRIDGTDINNWNPEELGANIGYLSQEVELLPGTVRENIARLIAQPDDQAVIRAAQKAMVHELIQKLPNGYDTRLGPGGFDLSGGQRQRIALARAFYGDPKLIVLDEPNANLDDDGNKALHQAIMAAKQSGTTVILVTQRKSALRIVDKIMRLNAGAVEFFGTTEEFYEKVREIQSRNQPAPAANGAAQNTPSKPPVPRPPNKVNEPRRVRAPMSLSASLTKNKPKPSNKKTEQTTSDQEGAE